MSCPPALLEVTPARMRWGARVLMGGLLALAQILAFAHMALVEHRTCALHGEALHGGHGAPTPSIETYSFPTAQPTGDAASDGHDHCVSVAPGRERFVMGPRGGDDASSQVSVQPRGSRDLERPAHPIAVISLAPKNSPPA